MAVPTDVVIARLSGAGHGRGLLMETALGTALWSRVRYAGYSPAALLPRAAGVELHRPTRLGTGLAGDS